MIKTLFILIVILTLCCPVVADQTLTIGAGTHTMTIGAGKTITVSGAVAATCPSGTYLFAWNGDYGSDKDKGCFTSGASQKDGTQSGGTLSATYGQTGVGFGLTANDQYVTWAISGNDGIDPDVGTMWLDVYLPAVSITPAKQIIVFECFADGSNHLSLGIRALGGLFGFYEGTSTGKTVTTSTLGVEGWNRVAYSWSRSGAEETHKHSVKLNAEAWIEDVEPLGTWAVSATSITIGEKDIGITHSDTVYIDDVYVLAGYQTAHP